MGKLVVTEFITVDGVMEDPGGSEGFERGGWAFDFDRGEAGDKFKFDEVVEAEVHLLGRRTYEEFAKAWPSREGEFADQTNNMPKYVVSTTLDTGGWEPATVLKGDVAEEVAKLKDEVDGVILVAGSAQLVQALLADRLVDELRLMVFPVVLGKGKRLFGDTDGTRALRLVDFKTTGECAIVTYEPVAKEA